MFCRKCGYARTSQDDVHFPDWQCPNCHRAYPGVRGSEAASTPASVAPGDSAESRAPAKAGVPPAVLVLLGILIGFGGGYFAGREHLKHELRTGFGDASHDAEPFAAANDAKDRAQGD